MVLEFPGSGGTAEARTMRKRERSEPEEERDEGKGCLKRKDEDLGKGSIVEERSSVKPR